MSAGVVPTDQQIARRARAGRAKELLSTEEVQHVFRQAERRALKAMRAASTPR